MFRSDELDADTLLKLTWAARRASELGAPLEFGSNNFEEIARSVIEPHPPSRKLDLLVLLVGNKTDTFGGSFRLDTLTDWPLVYARHTEELQNLIGTLAPYVIANPDKTGDLSPNRMLLTLTEAGWQRFEKIDAERPKSTAAFVAMWFAEEMGSAFNEGFYPALYDLGYDPVRVDREQYLGKIDDFIIASIRKSALVVADFSGMRSGVFFEAGFGSGLGVPVVFTCREDWLPELGKHFDTRQYNHLAWKDPGDLKVKLRTRIEAAVVGRPRPRS
jgi:hypothetical protein